VFAVGDSVYKRDDTTRVGISKKLCPPWKGPYLVVKVKPPLYVIRDRKRDSTVHHDRLKKCDDRQIPLWLKRARNHLFNQEGNVQQELDTEGISETESQLGSSEEVPEYSVDTDDKGVGIAQNGEVDDVPSVPDAPSVLPSTQTNPELIEGENRENMVLDGISLTQLFDIPVTTRGGRRTNKLGYLADYEY
jgi:hypothetical protein